jgi:hypothetical protein
MNALTISLSVMAGILIGRIQIIENHDANEAIATSKHLEKRLSAAKREVIRTRALLDKTERQLIGMWRRLEPMLEDFTKSDGLIDRDAARRRIESLRWEMSSVDATITAGREMAGEDPQTAMRQAHVKQSFGE